MRKEFIAIKAGKWGTKTLENKLTIKLGRKCSRARTSKVTTTTRDTGKLKLTTKN